MPSDTLFNLRIGVSDDPNLSPRLPSTTLRSLQVRASELEPEGGLCRRGRGLSYTYPLLHSHWCFAFPPQSRIHNFIPLTSALYSNLSVHVHQGPHPRVQRTHCSSFPRSLFTLAVASLAYGHNPIWPIYIPVSISVRAAAGRRWPANYLLICYLFDTTARVPFAFPWIDTHTRDPDTNESTFDVDGQAEDD